MAFPTLKFFCLYFICLLQPCSLFSGLSTCCFSWYNCLFLCKAFESSSFLQIEGSTTWDLPSINSLQKTISLLTALCDKPSKINLANTDVTNVFSWCFCGQIFTRPHSSFSSFSRKQTEIQVHHLLFFEKSSFSASIKADLIPCVNHWSGHLVVSRFKCQSDVLKPPQPSCPPTP